VRNIPVKEKKSVDFSGWEFPSSSLLNALPTKLEFNEELLETKSELIAEVLKQFKILVEMRGYQAGPTVVQYRLKPAEGIKLNKIESLKKDLTLALHAKSVRIQAPIP
jgi:S-DNA-T family DNA segregation ATPase FtsK/SpoIIIE